MNLVTRALAEIATIDPVRGGGGAKSIEALANQVVDIILIVAGALAVIYLIYSGILYITAAGNPDAAKKGQQGVVNAIIGIVIIVLAYVIVNAVTGSVNQAFN